MGSVAGAVAAIVALVAYLAPPDMPQPLPVGPVATTPAPPTPDPITTRPTTPVPAPPLSAVRPGGCDKAEAALAAYRRNAGATPSSQAAAANQAHLDLMGAVLDAEGMVGSTISRLAAEFQELSFRLTGMVSSDPNQVIADINTDIPQLTRLCGS